MKERNNFPVYFRDEGNVKQSGIEKPTGDANVITSREFFVEMCCFERKECDRTSRTNGEFGKNMEACLC